MNIPEGYRSGFVAICGRPNVGKSTLLNAIVGEKVAITSTRAQTTRHALRGVLTMEDHQIVFVDTPGIHKPKTVLGERLNETAAGSVSDVDVILFVIDATQPIGRGDQFVAAKVLRESIPAICVVTKTDIAKDHDLFPQLEAAGELWNFDEIIPVSAKHEKNIDRLHKLLYERMPEGPPYYPEDMATDQRLEFRVAELVREKALWLLRQEVPHSIAVVVEEFQEREDGVFNIEATIFVERDSQKGIVIGKGGQMLGDISMRARKELETLLGRKVYLRCQVKIRKDWQQDANEIARLGY